LAGCSLRRLPCACHSLSLRCQQCSDRSAMIHVSGDRQHASVDVSEISRER
jgi:hypothetical protein